MVRPRERDSSRLEHRDFKEVLEFLGRIYAISDFDTFRKQVVSGLQGLVPSEVNGYNEVDIRAQHNEVVYDRPEVIRIPDGDRIFDRYIPEHPLIAYSRNTSGHGAVKISDVISTRRFHGLGLYNEFFRRIGIEDQMVISFPSPRPVIVGVALNRKHRNFTERDRLLLNLINPHLFQAYSNIEAVNRLNREIHFAQRLLEESHAAVVWLKNGARVQHATLQARALLTQYFPGGRRPLEALPELLQRWLGQELARFGNLNDVPSPRRPLAIRRGSDDLIVRLISDNGQLCLLLEESLATKRGSAACGLTRREGEVLEWVSRGKTNWEIALILDISARTVQKHLEHIFQKLGVETRTAAAAKVRPGGES